MKVSILMASYNHAQYLPTAINSALSQTYSDFEIIVIDDCSKDNSRQIITQFQEEFPDKIKTVFHETNSGGHGGSVKSGFENSTGEIIAFLDSDDVWKPHKLQQIVEAFQDPTVMGVMHPLAAIDRDGNVIPSDTPNRPLPSGDLAKVIIDSGGTWNYPNTSALSFRRSALEKILPIVLAIDPPTWFMVWMDGCLLPCAAFLGQIQAINSVLGSYRLHDSNFQLRSQAHIVTKESMAKVLKATEDVNQWLNYYLECIGYPDRVDLSRNLDYRRKRYFFQAKWDAQEVQAISGLIFSWPFYTPLDRLKYLARFWIKSVMPRRFSYA
jgi:glycosyltransferase involved in cell wall biosynthesis